MRRIHVAQATRINLLARLRLRRQDLHNNVKGAINGWKSCMSHHAVDRLLTFIRRRHLVCPYTAPGHPVSHCTA